MSEDEKLKKLADEMRQKLEALDLEKLAQAAAGCEEQLKTLDEPRWSDDAKRRDHTKVWVRGEGLRAEHRKMPYHESRMVGLDAGGKEHDIQYAARPEVRIELTEENHLKIKWGARLVRKQARLKIWLNGYLAYDEYSNCKDRFLKRLQSLLDEIREHPSGYWHEDLTGRRVYWRGTPAVVTCQFDSRVVLRADVPEGFPDAVWAKEPYEKLENRHEVVTSVFDNNIWWWRKA